MEYTRVPIYTNRRINTEIPVHLISRGNIFKTKVENKKGTLLCFRPNRILAHLVSCYLKYTRSLKLETETTL